MNGPETTALDIVTLVIAVFAAVVGAGSLAWQIAQHALSGGRVRVELVAGWLMTETAIVSAPLATAEPPDWPFAAPLVGVRVNNVGRLPVVVQQWAVEIGPAALHEMDVSINPPVPHRLDIGAEQTWYVRAPSMVAAVEAASDHLGSASLAARVDLGNGKRTLSRKRYSPQVLRRLVPKPLF